MEQEVDLFYQHKGFNENSTDTNRYPTQKLNIRYSTMFDGAFMYLYAIIAYHAPFTEMITSIFYIIIFAFVLYAFWGILRLLFYGLRALFTRSRT